MKIKNIVGNERGSVMMEYVVLNFLFMVAIAIAGLFFIDPSGGVSGQDTYKIDPITGEVALQTDPLTGEAVKSKQYGILGDAFIKRYDVMLQIVSMPYP